ASEVKKGLCSSAESRVHAVWVPAFAGTTCWKIPYAIALSASGARLKQPLASEVKKGLCSSAEARVRAAAMSALRSRWGPCVRRDDLSENSICDSLALAGEGWGGGVSAKRALRVDSPFPHPPRSARNCA